MPLLDKTAAKLRAHASSFMEVALIEGSLYPLKWDGATLLSCVAGMQSCATSKLTFLIG